MIDALLVGRLTGKPTQRTGASGKPFVSCKVRVSLRDGEVLLVSVMVFSESVGATKLALEDCDSVGLSGALTPKVWTDRDDKAHRTLDMIASAALTAYQVRRKRQAMVRTTEDVD